MRCTRTGSRMAARMRRRPPQRSQRQRSVAKTFWSRSAHGRRPGGGDRFACAVVGAGSSGCAGADVSGAAGARNQERAVAGVGGEAAGIRDQVPARGRHQGGDPAKELDGWQHQGPGAVGQGALHAIGDLARRGLAHAVEGEGRPQGVAAQAPEGLAVVLVAEDVRVEREAAMEGGAALRGRRLGESCARQREGDGGGQGLRLVGQRAFPQAELLRQAEDPAHDAEQDDVDLVVAGRRDAEELRRLAGRPLEAGAEDAVRDEMVAVRIALERAPEALLEADGGVARAPAAVQPASLARCHLNTSPSAMRSTRELRSPSSAR